MRRSMFTAAIVLVLAAVLGSTVFREEVANAAQNLSVFVTNDAAHPVPVRQQGTLTVASADETQLLLDQVPERGFSNRMRLATYAGGHMFYTTDAARAAFHDDAMASYQAR